MLAARLRDRGLESRKEAVLCVAEDVAPDGPAAVVEALLVEDEVALDNELAESLDLVGEHLGFFAESKEAGCLVITDVAIWNRAIYRQ